MIFAILAQTDPISGGAGWVGAGLLGLVLGWLLLKHLPDKDKQIKDLLDAATKERVETTLASVKEREVTATAMEKIAQQDRDARHESNIAYQKAIAEVHTMHITDAKADREAFERRNENIVMALEKQTAELRAAMAVSCKYDRRQLGQIVTDQT